MQGGSKDISKLFNGLSMTPLIGVGFPIRDGDSETEGSFNLI
jgi:hypothetical protein